MSTVFNLRSLVAVAGVCAASSAFAQPLCGVRNSIRLAHGMCNNPDPSETLIDTGFVVAAPLVTPASAVRSNNCGASSSLSFVMNADYGALSYFGSGQGVSGTCCGIFLWADQYPAIPPNVQFFDRITIQSASLPSGSPVTLRATLTFAGGVSASNATTETYFAASMQVATAPTIMFTNQNGVTSQTVTVAVGQTRDVWAKLVCTLRDRRLLSNNGSGTIAADLSAFVTIESLTPGVTIASCSGHDYTRPVCDSIDFNRNGVFPEDQDVVDFFNVLAGGVCAQCSDIDFNNNTVFPEDQDVIDFFTVLAGGQCGA